MHVLEFRLRRYFPNCWRPKRRLSRGDYAAAAAEAGGRVRLGIPLAEEGWPKGEGSLAPQKWVGQEGLAAPEAEVLSFLGRTHAPAFRAAAAALSELNSAAKCLRRLALRRSAACAAIHSRRRRRANGERAGFIGTPCMLIMQASAAWPSAWLALRVLAGRQRGCCGRAEWGRAGNGAVGPRQCSSIFWLSLPLLLLPLPFLSLLLRA